MICGCSQPRELWFIHLIMNVHVYMIMANTLVESRLKYNNWRTRPLWCRLHLNLLAYTIMCEWGRSLLVYTLVVKGLFVDKSSVMIETCADTKLQCVLVATMVIELNKKKKNTMVIV